MKKLTLIAASVAVAALAGPAAGLVDSGTPPQGSRIDRIKDRIAKIEARIDAASKRIDALQQKIDQRCNVDLAQPATPAAGAGQAGAPSTPDPADPSAKANPRLHQRKARVQKARDPLADIHKNVQHVLR